MRQMQGTPTTRKRQLHVACLFVSLLTRDACSTTPICLIWFSLVCSLTIISLQGNYRITRVSCRSDQWKSCTSTEDSSCSHREDVFLSCSKGEKHPIKIIIFTNSSDWLHVVDLSYTLPNFLILELAQSSIVWVWLSACCSENGACKTLQ